MSDIERWLTDEAVAHAERALYDQWSAVGETTTKEDVRTIVRALAEYAPLADARGAIGALEEIAKLGRTDGPAAPLLVQAGDIADAALARLKGQ